MSYRDRIQQRNARTIGDVIAALIASPYLPALGELFVDALIGRPRIHPGWVPVAYSALARHFTTFGRLDAELAGGLWDQLNNAATIAGLEPAGHQAFWYYHHAYWRDLVINDNDTRTELCTRLTTIALQQARTLGLLTPNGAGSLTHPDRTRVIYGDGTIVRPRFKYRPDQPDARNDPSAATHTRHDGHIWGNNFVFFSARHQQPRTRLMLAVGRVPEPGAEASTAVEIIQRINELAGPGIVGVAYDGALQGAHIEQIMRSTGLIVINKPHLALRKTDDAEPVVKRRVLGTYHYPGKHDECAHQLAAINGRIADIEPADDGEPTVVAWAERQQIKRVRRKDDTYRFNLAIRLHCRHHNTAWTTWLSPHDDPENIRLVPPDDPAFDPLYCIRPDAESLNNNFKRSLLIDRAASIGWKRQLYDAIGYAILHNSLTTTAR